jgi:hypothetical protein
MDPVFNGLSFVQPYMVTMKTSERGEGEEHEDEASTELVVVRGQVASTGLTRVNLWASTTPAFIRIQVIEYITDQ